MWLPNFITAFCLWTGSKIPTYLWWPATVDGAATVIGCRDYGLLGTKCSAKYLWIISCHLPTNPRGWWCDCPHSTADETPVQKITWLICRWGVTWRICKTLSLSASSWYSAQLLRWGGHDTGWGMATCLQISALSDCTSEDDTCGTNGWQNSPKLEAKLYENDKYFSGEDDLG